MPQDDIVIKAYSSSVYPYPPVSDAEAEDSLTKACVTPPTWLICS